MMEQLSNHEVPEDINEALIWSIANESAEQFEARIVVCETGISVSVLSAAEKSGDRDKVESALDHWGLYGLSDGDHEEDKQIIWALQHNLLIAAEMLVSYLTYPQNLTATDQEGQTALQLARRLGADLVVAEILSTAESLGLTPEEIGDVPN